jgi:hypothetical protein
VHPNGVVHNADQRDGGHAEVCGDGVGNARHGHAEADESDDGGRNEEDLLKRNVLGQTLAKDFHMSPSLRWFSRYNIRIF